MFNTEEIDTLLSSNRHDAILNVVCSNCGKSCLKRYRYIREQRAIAEDGIVKIYCCYSCHSESNKHKFYSKVPCDCCGIEFLKSNKQIESTNGNFCSRSCSTKVTNSKRVRTEESRKKISDSLKRIYADVKQFQHTCSVCEKLFSSSSTSSKYCSNKCRELAKHGLNDKEKTDLILSKINEYPNKQLYCYIKFKNCQHCGSAFCITESKKGKSKFCSKECQSSWQSKFQSERISKAENRTNLGRHRRSYPETCMIAWLDANGISYDFEPSLRNHESKRTYFPDFVFKELGLIIELDGTQHKKTVEKDRLRDDYIEKTYGFKVIRYWCKDFLKGKHYEEICKLLGVSEDKAPMKS